MASIVPGYEYDIFISYRQKDNKGDRWVSEFVDALKTELESTFKEEISVYFDINPHDGLLETHDVNASLKEKLKCLVFIPIISRTYCDPKSFAWEHEFKPFVEQASQDKYGLKVKLPTGNVANRILPVQIHDLYPEDKSILERELGGVLRSIEFIYKEPGVNRPLTSKDNEEKNSNKTNYRNQINKVGNAIDEVIRSLKNIQSPPLKDQTTQSKPFKEDKKEDSRKEVISKGIIDQRSKKLLIILLSVFVCIAGVFTIYKIKNRIKLTQDLTKLEKSIAVLPFANDSPEKENEYFCNGMMDEILNQLQKIGDLIVKDRKSVEKYRNADTDIKVIGKELGVSMIMEGSVRKAGEDIRIIVHLIDTKTGNHLWAETYNGKHDTAIFEFQSNVAKKVAGSLNVIITPKEEKRIDIKPTTEMLAHDLVLKGGEMEEKWYFTHDSLNLKLSLNLFNQALKIDPKYIDALAGKANTFREIGKYDSAIFYYEKTNEIDPNNLPGTGGIGSVYMYSNKGDSALRYLEKALELRPNDPWANLAMGQLLSFSKNNLVKGLSYLKKAYDLEGNTDAGINVNIGIAFMIIGDYPKALKYTNNALTLRSECDLIIQYDYILTAQGKFDEALHFLDSICNINACEQKCDIMKFRIYTTQKEFEKAEKYYNQAENSGYKRTEDDEIYIACLYKETGRKKEAFSILNNAIKRDEKSFKSAVNAWMFKLIELRLAAAYSMLNDNKKALYYLSELEKAGLIEFPCTIRTFPGFDNLRDDAEFKVIVERIEDKRAVIRAQVKEMEERGELHL